MATTDHTNGVTLSDAGWADDVDCSAYSVLSGVAGTNTITATGPATYTYAATRPPVWFIPANTNTGATTINITPSGGAALGAKNIFWNGVACVGGEIRQNVPTALIYDGTQFHIVARGSNGPFLDTHPVAVGSSDSTKKVRVEVDGLTTATTRVVTIPDRDLTIGLVLGTEQATTSGTAINFTGIPAATRRITIMFEGVSVSGTSNPLVRIGDSGGVEATGYAGRGAELPNAAAISAIDFTTGMGIASGNAAHSLTGVVVLNQTDAANNTWLMTGTLSTTAGTVALYVSAAVKSLSAELDRVQITTVNGTDTFDAGSINISYE